MHVYIYVYDTTYIYLASKRARVFAGRGRSSENGREIYSRAETGCNHTHHPINPVTLIYRGNFKSRFDFSPQARARIREGKRDYRILDVLVARRRV